MGTAWHPTWWKEEQHEKTWERVKEAMKRDWEQTLSDVGVKGKHDLDQDVDDTVKQASGKDKIPQAGMPNAPGGTPAHATSSKWQDVETPLKYGVAARDYYGKDHSAWNPELEGKLKGEWEKGRGGNAWDEVKSFVKHGFDHPRS